MFVVVLLIGIVLLWLYNRALPAYVNDRVFKPPRLGQHHFTFDLCHLLFVPYLCASTESCKSRDTNCNNSCNNSRTSTCNSICNSITRRSIFDTVSFLPFPKIINLRQALNKPRHYQFLLPMRLLVHPESCGITVLYSHNSSSDMVMDLAMMEYLYRELKCNIVHYEYPGYGWTVYENDGLTNEFQRNTRALKVSEQAVLDSAESVMQYLLHTCNIPENKIFLMSVSLGCAPSIYLASRYRNIRGMILVSAFTSIVKTLPYNGLFVLPYIYDMFDNLALIPRTTCPVLLFHGTQDKRVPFHHAIDLLEAFCARKSCSCDNVSSASLVVVDGANHYDLPVVYGKNKFISRIQTFIAQHGY